VTKRPARMSVTQVRERFALCWGAGNRRVPRDHQARPDDWPAISGSAGGVSWPDPRRWIALRSQADSACAFSP
jgi:hypothetical protein